MRVRTLVLRLVAVAAIVVALVAASADATDEPAGRKPNPSWNGGAVAADGWLVDDTPITVTATTARRGEPNPAQGRNIQITDASGRLVADVDSAGDPVHLEGVGYPGDATGNLLIAVTVRRHCTAGWSEPLVADGYPGANESAGVCPSGTITRYSVGRLISTETKYLTGGFDLATTVKLPSDRLQGTRFSVWLNNWRADVGQPVPTYCSAGVPTTNISEFDVFEWYGLDAGLTQSVHASCDYPEAGGTLRATADAGATSGWVDARTRFDGGSAEFFLGTAQTLAVGPAGSGYPAAAWNRVPTVSQWHDAMITQGTVPMRWSVLVTADVFGAATPPGAVRPTAANRLAAVNDQARFPAQTMLLDGVRVTDLG